MHPSNATLAGTSDEYSGTLIGAVLAGRYRVLHLIGDGGMGRVYAADDLQLERRVAVKVLREELSRSRPNVERFLQEARATSLIDHPNVVRLLDYGQVPGGSVFLAMELLDGEDLAQVLARRVRVTWSEAQSIAVQVARGLQAAHDHGVIHRDMKPANIFLVGSSEGALQVKLLDFGVAKLMRDGGAALTSDGSVFGTARYMSPEQASGKGVDERSDVYAVGVLLYEMLTGRAPFEGDNFLRVATAHVTESIVPVREVAPDVGISPTVESMVMRALAKDPNRRYSSMADFEAALLGASFDETVMTQNPLFESLAERTMVYDPRSSRPHPIAAPAEVLDDVTLVHPRAIASAEHRIVAPPPPRVPVEPAAKPTAWRWFDAVVPDAKPVFEPKPELGDVGRAAGLVAPPRVEAIRAVDGSAHKTLPPMSWIANGANASTDRHTRRLGEGDNTAEFGLNVPVRELSRNLLVVIVALSGLTLVACGVALWALFGTDDEQTVATEVHPAAVADEPRPPVRQPSLPAEPEEPSPRAAEPIEPAFEPEPEPEPEPAPPSSPPRSREGGSPERLLRLGFDRAKDSIAACGRKHGGIEGVLLKITFDVRGGRAANVEVQRPHDATPLGRCVAGAVESSARFAGRVPDTTEVKRAVVF